MKSVPGADAWEVTDEYVADDDIVILGFDASCIGRGLNGAIAISRSGTVEGGFQPQDDVLYYQEVAGVGGATSAILSHNTMFFPADKRPDLEEGDRLHLWIESGDTNIQHVVMYYYIK